jgi:hypothetical protein
MDNSLAIPLGTAADGLVGIVYVYDLEDSPSVFRHSCDLLKEVNGVAASAVIRSATPSGTGTGTSSSASGSQQGSTITFTLT